MIDSDVLIDVLRHRPEAVAWFAGLLSVQRVSGATALELLFGSQDAGELHRVRRFLSRLEIEWSNEEDLKVASSFAAVKLSHGIEILDAVTAATALRLGEDLLTFNDKHFRAIPGLAIVKPYERK